MVKRQGSSKKGIEKDIPTSENDNMEKDDFFNEYDSSDDSVGKDSDSQENSEDDFDAETPAEKRVRLAKQYLTKITKDKEISETNGDYDAADLDRDIIAERLQEDVMENYGKSFRKLADLYDFERCLENMIVLEGQHSKAVTCLAMTKDFLFSGSKDSNIIVWSLESGRVKAKLAGKARNFYEGQERPNFIGHHDQIFSLAINYDGKFLASGGKDHLINIWDISGLSEKESSEEEEEIKHLKTFRSHRKPVSCLCFRNGHNQLYSGSFDRSVKVWNIDELGYVETLFGHQDAVWDIDCINREQCATVGSRDRSCRLFKIPQESQLVFRLPDQIPAGGSVDAVAMLDEETIISGSDAGVINVWSIHKKKPVATVFSCDADNGPREAITSIRCFKFSDLIVTGGSNGTLQFWKFCRESSKLTLRHSVSLSGCCINSIAIYPMGESIRIAVSLAKEPKFGRWFVHENASNSIAVFKIEACKTHEHDSESDISDSSESDISDE